MRALLNCCVLPDEDVEQPSTSKMSKSAKIKKELSSLLSLDKGEKGRERSGLMHHTWITRAWLSLYESKVVTRVG